MTTTINAITYGDIAPGDIILFKRTRADRITQTVIMLFQALLLNKHGHYDTVHAGICVGVDPVKGPIIAHVTGGKFHRYVKEPLATVLERDGERRPLLIYRHQDQAVSQQIADCASQANKNIFWSVGEATKMFYQPTTMVDSTPATIQRENFCSKFVVQVINQANKKCGKQPVKVNSNITPKTLESFIYKHSSYQRFLHTGDDNPVKQITLMVEQEVARLSDKLSSASRKKSQLISQQLYSILDLVTTKHAKADPIVQARIICDYMLPFLKRNTGINFRNATSYTNLMRYSQHVGLFRADVNRNNTATQQLPIANTQPSRCVAAA